MTAQEPTPGVPLKMSRALEEELRALANSARTTGDALGGAVVHLHSEGLTAIAERLEAQSQAFLLVEGLILNAGIEYEPDSEPPGNERLSGLDESQAKLLELAGGLRALDLLIADAHAAATEAGTRPEAVQYLGKLRTGILRAADFARVNGWRRGEQ
ncbi:MAG: hypothetical protein ACYC8T_20875 [Myxococcaceae bacterium]